MADITVKNLAEYVKNEVPTKKEMDERFDKVDERFENVDDRFENVDDRFDKVDERFENVDDRFDKMDDRFDKMDDRFEKVDDRLDKTDDRLNRLTNYVLKEIPDIKNKLEEKADKKDIQTILNGQDQIMKQLDIIRTEQVATSATLDRHEKRLEVLENNIIS